MAEINALSETDASNTSISGTSVAENCPAANINDAIRNFAGMAKRAWDRDHAIATVGGTANAITLAYTAGPAAYVTGEKFCFKATGTNTGATTINVSSLGAKTVVRPDGGAFVGGEIISGAVVEAVYDGTNFQLPALTNFVPVAQCRLVKSSTNLVLQPYNGSRVTMPDGTTVTLGSSGISVAAPTSVTLNGTAAQTLSTGTLYYVYLWNNAGTLTLDFSTTAWAVDAASGLPIKSGVATRLLVGMVRVPSTAWVDSVTQRFIASYWNRSQRPLQGANPAAGTNSGTLNEFSTSYRVEFLTWADEAVAVAASGYLTEDTGSTIGSAQLHVDGSAVGGLQSVWPPAINQGGPVGLSWPVTATDGYHYAGLMGKVTGGTATFQVFVSAIVRI